MKLKNKISGEIKEFILFDGNELQGGATLESLTKEWEDAPEEPKRYWGIDYCCCRTGGIEEFSYDDDNIDEFNKSIGNYFETKEEAEKAVEKLKALKRLKDNNLRFRRGRMTFVNTDDVFTTMDVGVKVDTYVDVEADLDLLFSQEGD